MDTNDVFGEILESAGTAAKQTGKAVVNAASATVQTAASQVGVPVADSSGANSIPDTNTQDVVESLYGKSQTQQTASPQQQMQMPQQNPATGSVDRTPQEQAEMEVVRKRLHDEYYQSLINPPKQEEESVSEKLEREDKEEEMDLQQKEMEKPPDLATQRAAQRVEKNPGASG